MSKFQYNPNQFNSTRRISPGSYSTAAQNLTRALNNIYEINRKTAPDFSALAQRQMDNNTLLALENIKAQTQMTTTGLQTLGEVQKNKLDLKADQIEENGRRAGRLMLYGGGAIMQGMKMANRKPIEKPEPIYEVETEFQYPESPYKKELDGFKNNGLGPAPVMPDASQFTGGNPQGANIPFTGSGGSDGPPAIPNFDQPSPQAPASGVSRTPMTKGQYQQILLNNGWSPELAPTMARIGMGESSGKFWDDTAASGLDPQRRNEFSVGAWQINTKAHMDKINARGWTVEDLRDPNKNAQLALEVYNEAGGFHPWGAYTNNSYLKH